MDLRLRERRIFLALYLCHFFDVNSSMPARVFAWRFTFGRSASPIFRFRNQCRNKIRCLSQVLASIARLGNDLNRRQRCASVWRCSQANTAGEYHIKRTIVGVKMYVSQSLPQYARDGGDKLLDISDTHCFTVSICYRNLSFFLFGIVRFFQVSLSVY